MVRKLTSMVNSTLLTSMQHNRNLYIMNSTSTHNTITHDAKFKVLYKVMMMMMMG